VIFLLLLDLLGPGKQQNLPDLIIMRQVAMLSSLCTPCN
jgi:hypothetical protein